MCPWVRKEREETEEEKPPQEAAAVFGMTEEQDCRKQAGQDPDDFHPRLTFSK